MQSFDLNIKNGIRINVQKLTLSDPEVSPYLKVIMVENYNVTEASHLITACDISEQISLASKEASGTGI